MDARPHLLYMFEFVIDDLIITQKNYCAPEEYSTCVELTFRSNVYVSMCDRDDRCCVNPNQKRFGKRCIFPLESPITKQDCISVHVYKKRSDRCKFLIGLSEIKVKPLFDAVDELFEQQNSDWYKKRKTEVESLATLKGPNVAIDRCDCYDAASDPKEQLCPLSSIVKQMVPFFNLCHRQTGNLVLIVRLTCQGPTITSAFCQEGNRYVPMPPPKKLENDPCSVIKAEPAVVVPKKCYRFFTTNADKLCPCDICEDAFDRDCPTVPKTKAKSSRNSNSEQGRRKKCEKNNK